MTRAKAIKTHCSECAGDVASDVVLCQIKDCPLWPFRLGCGMKSDVYAKRIDAAWEKHSDAADDARDQGLDIAFFKISSNKTSHSGDKLPASGKSHTKRREGEKSTENRDFSLSAEKEGE